MQRKSSLEISRAHSVAWREAANPLKKAKIPESKIWELDQERSQASQ
jgi:hypothetical protein